MSDQEKKYVHKASSGSLFKNQYKEKDSQPDYNLYVEPMEQEQNTPNPSAPDVNELPF